jgi:hypothetical protein
MPQKIETMSEEDVRRVEAQRTWVRDHYQTEAQHEYETAEGKLRLIETILNANWIEPTETWKLQSLGIALGDVLAQEMGLNWVIVDDEFGRDPALQLPNSTIVVFPLTAVSKRIERGEKVDARDLLEGFKQTIEEKRREGF